MTLRWANLMTCHFFHTPPPPPLFAQFGPTWNLGRCQCSLGIRSSLSWSPANQEWLPSLLMASSLSIRAKVTNDPRSFFSGHDIMKIISLLLTIRETSITHNVTGITTGNTFYTASTNVGWSYQEPSQCFPKQLRLNCKQHSWCSHQYSSSNIVVTLFIDWRAKMYSETNFDWWQ